MACSASTSRPAWPGTACWTGFPEQGRRLACVPSARRPAIRTSMRRTQQRGRPRGGLVGNRPSRVRGLLLLAARHLAFHTLDVEADATQEFVVGDGVLRQNFLAGVVHN